MFFNSFPAEINPPVQRHVCFTFSPRDTAPLFIRQDTAWLVAPSAGSCRLGFDGQSGAWAGSTGTERRTGGTPIFYPRINTPLVAAPLRGGGACGARPRRIPCIVCAWGSYTAPHVHRGKHQRLPVWMHWHWPAENS